ncbi:MAG: glycosyltransferase family 4 protein [Phycisphaerales bacterium]|jgi:glycosyltransferase involved in cell wall biosynthesis|nr:glycosyltransferase family 4 protein [Phycisphaerales bacterium]
MRILMVHNFYREAGGEDVVFAAEGALLESHGQEVERLTFDNDEIPDRRGIWGSAKLAGRTIWSTSAAKRVRQAVQQFRPRVVHFHNTFPLISPSAYSACRAEGAAVVQTLHNYRLMCINALLFRDGGVCEDCVGHGPWAGVKHGCYRSSRAQSAVVAAMLSAHRIRRTWNNDVDLYFAPTEFARDKFIQGGLPADKIIVKPNFLEPNPGPKSHAGDYFLFVGRLTRDKGVEFLLRTWMEHKLQQPLHIVGDGPLADAVREAAGKCPAIRYLGPMDRKGVIEQMHRARACIFASQLYETFGMVALESMACALPVLATKAGATATIINDGRTGLLFDPSSPQDLAAKVNHAWDHPDEMMEHGKRGQEDYLRRFTGSRNFQMMMAGYERAIVAGCDPDQNSYRPTALMGGITEA